MEFLLVVNLNVKSASESDVEIVLLLLLFLPGQHFDLKLSTELGKAVVVEELLGAKGLDFVEVGHQSVLASQSFGSMPRSDARLDYLNLGYLTKRAEGFLEICLV